MKKIISIILILSLSLTWLPVFSSGNTQADFKYENELNELYSLGIIENIEEFDPQKVITRGEFAREITMLLNIIPEHIYYEDIFYYDVPEEHPYFLEIMYCAHQKWMLGTGENTFMPEENITIGQAIKVMVSVLNYDYLADAEGGYIAGYITVANRLGILKGISGNYEEPLIASTFIKLLNNALDVAIPEKTGIDQDGNVTYDINTKNTLLSKYYDCYKGEGVVTANDTVIIEGVAAGENQIVISGNIIDISDVKHRNFIGMNVEYIYKMEKDSTKKELISIADKNTDKVEINMKDYINLTLNGEYSTLTYDVSDNKTEDVKISRSALYVKNGIVELSPSQSLFDNSKIGTVTLIKWDNSSYYNLVIIKEYESFVIGRVNYDNLSVVNYHNSSSVYSFDPENKKVILTNDKGEESTLENIKEDMVISVAEANDKSVIEAIFTENRVSGLYSSLDSSNNKATISGIELKIKQGALMTVSLGLNVTAYLDAFNNIIYAKLMDDDGFIRAFYIKSADRTTAGETSVIVKLYDLSGKMAEYKIAQNIAINGVQLVNKTSAGLNEKLGSAHPLIKVKLNSDNEIRNIVTASNMATLLSDDTKDEFCYVSGNYEYAKGSNHFGFLVYLNSSVNSYLIPDGENVSEEDITVITGSSSFVNTNTYDLIAYFESKNDLNPIALKLPDGSIKVTTGSSATPALVKKVTQTVNNEGETINKIYLLKGGVETSVFSKGNVARVDGTETDQDLEPGDVILYSENTDKVLTSFMFLYDADKPYGTETGSIVDDSGDFFSTNSWGRCEVDSIHKDYLNVSRYNVKSNINNETTGIPNKFVTSELMVYKVENINGSSPVITLGSSEDFDKGDIFFIFLKAGTPSMAVIYK